MKFKVAFLTTNYFGCTLLYYLLKDEFVKRNIKFYLIYSSSWIENKNVLLISFITNENDKQKFFENKLDLLIVAGWRQIIPKDILYFAEKKTIGFHPAPLPKGRGSAPFINKI